MCVKSYFSENAIFTVVKQNICSLSCSASRIGVCSHPIAIYLQKRLMVCLLFILDSSLKDFENLLYQCNVKMAKDYVCKKLF